MLTAEQKSEYARVGAIVVPGVTAPCEGVEEDANGSEEK